MTRIWVIPACMVLTVSAQDWRYWGGDPGGARFSALKQIHRGNVAKLRNAWTYRTGEVKPGAISSDQHRIEPFEATPLVIDNVLYFSTQSSRVIALDPETGNEIWRFDPQAGHSPRVFHAHRGVAYWQNTDGSDRRILFGTFDGRLMALDAATGKPRPDFGDSGSVDLRAGFADRWPDDVYSVTSPPAIYKDLAIVGAECPEYPSKGPSGAVRAFDVRTGKLVWTFHTIPQWARPVTPNGTTEPGKTAQASMFGPSSVWTPNGDGIPANRLGLLRFLRRGSQGVEFVRQFAGSAGRGKRKVDLVLPDGASRRLGLGPASPARADHFATREPRDPGGGAGDEDGISIHPRPSHGQTTFSCGRAPGSQSDVPGEATWPTQPFPLKPPPLSRQSFSASEITTVTQESHRYCSELFRSLEYHGMYTPYGLKMTLVVPGTLGGGTWSGGSFDPSNGYFFVNTNEAFAVGALKPEPDGAPERYRRASPLGEYARFWDENQWPCQQPPWGTLNAVDVNTGQIAWKVPLGRVDVLKMDTGTPNLGGSIATAGGLVFIGATIDDRFRAFDSKTGKQLWVTDLEAAAHATPVTYIGRKSAKQFVVVAAGGGGYFRGKVSDTLVAFALPN